MPFGQPPHPLRDGPVRRLGEPELRQGIDRVGVVAGTDHDQVRAKLVDRGGDAAVESLQPSVAVRPGRDRNVHCRADRARSPAVLLHSGARIPRVLVHRCVQHLGRVVEDVLRSVAVMHVEIDYGDARGTIAQRSTHRDGRVVEQAETHRSKRGRMVSRRADHGEYAPRFAGNDSIDRARGTGSGVERNVVRGGGAVRVGVEPAAATSGPSGASAIARLMATRMRPPRLFRAASTASSSAPPCAPTPGSSSGASGAVRRTHATTDGSVVPTTKPAAPPGSHSKPSSTMRLYTVACSAIVVSNRSAAPGLLLRVTRNAPRSGRARNGATASCPMSGLTVTASAPRTSKRARAYASAVLPMSPRLPSRIRMRTAGTRARRRSRIA